MNQPHFRQLQDPRRNFSQTDGEITADVTTFYDGPVTETRVTIYPRFSDSPYYGEGFALCMPGDHYDPDLGQRLSYVRAVIDALREAELHLISQVKTKKQFQKAVQSDDVPDDWTHYPGDLCEVA